MKLSIHRKGSSSRTTNGRALIKHISSPSQPRLVKLSLGWSGSTTQVQVDGMKVKEERKRGGLVQAHLRGAQPKPKPRPSLSRFQR